MILRIVQVMREVARHVSQQHVVGDVGSDHQTNTGKQAFPVLGGDLLERHFWPFTQAVAVALFQLINVLLEGWGLFQRMAQVESNHAQRQRQEERQTPAPFEEACFANYRSD